MKKIIIFLLFVLSVSLLQNVYAQENEFLEGFTIGGGITLNLQNLQNSNVIDPISADGEVLETNKTPTIGQYSVDLTIEKAFDDNNKAFIHLETGKGNINYYLDSYAGINRDADDTGVLSLLESTKPGEYVLQVLGVASPEGKYRGVLSASDNYGLSAEYVIDYEVLPNSAPVVVKQIDNILLNYAGDMVKINMEEYVVDPDGETLAYDITISDNSVVHLSQSATGAVLTLTAIADTGLANVTLEATDAGGKTISVSFKVLVRSSELEMQAYPNPVVETLYVGTGKNPESAKITLYNALGAKVYSTSAYCSAFEPAAVNMRNAGPGLYTLEVEYGGKVYKSNLIKK